MLDSVATKRILALIAMLQFANILNSFYSYASDIDSLFPNSSEVRVIDRFIRQTNSYELNMTLTEESLFVLFQNYEDKQIYYREYTKLDIGQEINSKYRLYDIYLLLKCGKSSVNQSQPIFCEEQICKFENIVSFNEQPCYKMGRDGQITTYLGITSSLTGQSVVEQAHLRLYKLRKMTQAQIQRIKTKSLLRQIERFHRGYDIQRKLSDQIKQLKQETEQQRNILRMIKEGRIFYKNGDIYTGSLSFGRRSGRGIIKCANGDTYQGEWMNDKMKGIGEFKWENGDRYVGSFKNDQKHGKGTYYYFDGSIYEGQWFNDRIDGKGQLTWGNKNKYIGSFQNDKKHGRGKIQFANGDRLTGEWQNDMKQGVFIYEFKEQNFKLRLSKEERVYRNNQLISSKRV